MSNEPTINTHQYEDPFHNKVLQVQTLDKDSKVIAVYEQPISSKEEFSTLLEEVKQYNNDPTNIEEHRSKRIII
jgi:hypothetical protein